MRYHNVVHLSDLHLHRVDSTGRYNQDLIIDALSKDLAGLRDSALQPDCLVFSGDLVQAGDGGEYANAATILSLLAQSAGLTDDQVFVVPGNHDASRTAIGPEIPRLKEIREQADSIDKINGLVKRPDVLSYGSSVFSAYETATAGYGSRYLTSASFFVRQFYMRDINLAIVCINTSFLSGSGLSDDVKDEAQLVFPERALVEALKRVPDGSQTLVVGHHPLSYLSETCRRYLKPLIMKDADLYLFGHMHRAEPEEISSPVGRCMFIQSGSLYASREWWNGYSIVSYCVGKPHTRITYRKWQEQRREFGVASELSDDGVTYSSSDAKSFWSAIAPRIPARAIEGWRKSVLLPFLTEQLCDEGPTQADDVFVPPEFERDRYVEAAGTLEKTTTPDQLSFQDAVRLTDNIVVAAQAESGKTTLIRRWALQLAGAPYAPTDWSIPVVIRFHEIKKYLSQLESLVRGRLPSLPAGQQAASLLEAGQITLFVDDADLKHGEKNASLVSFISKYPRCRYILLTGTPYLQGAGIAPIIAADVPFMHIRLKRLKKSQILELIEGRGTTDPAKADRLLQRMTQEAASLNVPITPVTGTFLIQIYTEDNGKPLVNRANLIERYVEIVLEKFAPEDLLPSSFDYRNKSDVLSFIATHMCRAGDYTLPDTKFITLVDEYLKNYGLRFSSIDILEYFVKARILSREGHQVSFRLSAFLSYFAALSMAEDNEFRAFVLDEERYLSFHHEISFYSAISRRDRDWLNDLLARFETTSAAVWKDAPEQVRDGTLLNNFKPLGEKAKEEDIFEIERRIFEEPLTEEERRKVLDGELEADVAISQHVVRRSKVDLPAAWLNQLMMLSDVLKNMEFIDTASKERVLAVLVKGWLQFTCMTMGIVPSLARDKQMTVGGISYQILNQDDQDVAETARRLMSYVPIAVSKIAAHNLGTEKLRSQLEQGIGGDPKTVDPSTQFMRASILAQIGADAIAGVLEKARSSLKGHRYLEEVFVRQLAEIVVRFRLPDNQLNKIRLLAAGTIVDLEHRSGMGAIRRKNQVVSSLMSSRLRVRVNDKDHS